MRLIDASQFMDELNEAQVEFDEYYKGLGKAKLMLLSQPAVKPEKEYSEWKNLNCMNEAYGFCYECKACGYQVIGNSNFCPECGKEMKNGESRA